MRSRLYTAEDAHAPLPSQPICWDVCPAFAKSIRLGEVEAADEREAIEEAAKKFKQDLAILLVRRRT